MASRCFASRVLLMALYGLGFWERLLLLRRLFSSQVQRRIGPHLIWRVNQSVTALCHSLTCYLVAQSIAPPKLCPRCLVNPEPSSNREPKAQDHAYVGALGERSLFRN